MSALVYTVLPRDVIYGRPNFIFNNKAAEVVEKKEMIASWNCGQCFVPKTQNELSFCFLTFDFRRNFLLPPSLFPSLSLSLFVGFFFSFFPSLSLSVRLILFLFLSPSLFLSLTLSLFKLHKQKRYDVSQSRDKGISANYLT